MAVHVIGLGQDHQNLSGQCQALIQKARVLVAGKNILQHFAAHPAEKIPVISPISEVLASIRQHHEQGQEVVVLATGDPLFYGIGATLVKSMGAEEITFYPGITTLQRAAARLGFAWQEVVTVSLHGRDDWSVLFAALMHADRVCVYTDRRAIPSAIAQAVLDKGGEIFRMHVLEDLEGAQERIQCLSLSQAAQQSFSPCNTVILERVAQPEKKLTLGLDDECYVHEKNLITKRLIRAAGIACLEIQPDSVVWDLGAGCGACAIEASALAHRGQVVAVERKADRVAMIRENVRRTGAYLVDVVHGTLPGVLAEIPGKAPDRLFIGGGLGRGQESKKTDSVLPGDVLTLAMQYLCPGGKLVLHAVLLGSLFHARSMFEEQGWQYSISLVSTAQSAPLARDLHLKSVNPVFILTACKPCS